MGIYFPPCWDNSLDHRGSIVCANGSHSCYQRQPRAQMKNAIVRAAGKTSLQMGRVEKSGK